MVDSIAPHLEEFELLSDDDLRPPSKVQFDQHLAAGGLVTYALVMLSDQLSEDQILSAKKKNFQNAVYLTLKAADILVDPSKADMAGQELEKLDSRFGRRMGGKRVAISDWLSSAVIREDFPDDIPAASVREKISGLVIQAINGDVSYWAALKDPSYAVAQKTADYRSRMTKLGIEFTDQRLRICEEDMSRIEKGLDPVVYSRANSQAASLNNSAS